MGAGPRGVARSSLPGVGVVLKHTRLLVPHSAHAGRAVPGGRYEFSYSLRMQHEYRAVNSEEMI